MKGIGLYGGASSRVGFVLLSLKPVSAGEERRREVEGAQGRREQQEEESEGRSEERGGEGGDKKGR